MTLVAEFEAVCFRRRVVEIGCSVTDARERRFREDDCD